MKKHIIRRGLSLLLAAAIVLLCACNRNSGVPEIPDEDFTSRTVSNTVRVTFPEGSTVSQIGDLLEENGVCTKTEFLAEVNNSAHLADLPFKIENPTERTFLLEGYVFPDTYEFYLNEGAAAALGRFLKNTRAKLTADYSARASELGYTLDEILIIASIVQEEAGFIEQMPLVSSVLHNRLNSPAFSQLQCDVTREYLERYVKEYVSEERYSQLTPIYNTYKCLDLPAGPITNVGTHAIEAALYPAQTDYYFFVTDTDMNYYYASTWEEHCANCRTAGIEGY